ncbi:MAG: DUF2905 domain-containing protein [bacterium]
MMNFDSFGKLFLLLGIVFLGLGCFFIFFKNIPFLGKLPGDILVQKKNYTFYFPISTSILLSIVLSLILYLITRK